MHQLILPFSKPLEFSFQRQRRNRLSTNRSNAVECLYIRKMFFTSGGVVVYKEVHHQRNPVRPVGTVTCVPAVLKHELFRTGSQSPTYQNQFYQSPLVIPHPTAPCMRHSWSNVRDAVRRWIRIRECGGTWLIPTSVISSPRFTSCEQTGKNSSVPQIPAKASVIHALSQIPTPVCKRTIESFAMTIHERS